MPERQTANVIAVATSQNNRAADNNLFFSTCASTLQICHSDDKNLITGAELLLQCTMRTMLNQKAG
jgi:hypothetical protein